MIESQAGANGSKWGSEVLTVLERQRDLLGELTSLAERQGALIDDGRGEALLELLAARQQVVDGFIGTDAELSKLLAELPTRLPGLAPDRRQALSDAAIEVDRRLARLHELDTRDRDRLRAARDRTRGCLTSIDAGRQANQAYRRPSSVTTRFADERG